MTPRIAFSHVGIYVKDVERMARFYSRFLELTVTDRGEYDTAAGRTPFAFLSSDPREHHQLVLAGGRPQDLPFNVVNQISFRLRDFATLRDLHRRLASDEQKEGVSDVRPITHGNAMSVYFRDPEGNRVELFIDTPWYVNQPMIIPMDMSLDDAALWKWVEDTASKLPGFRPVEAWRADLEKRMSQRGA
jgi:catechol-2,3-dioxygenase